MARSHYKAAKRQKELAKKKKKEEKQQRRLEKKSDQPEEITGISPDETRDEAAEDTENG